MAVEAKTLFTTCKKVKGYTKTDVQAGYLSIGKNSTSGLFYVFYPSKDT